MFSKMNAAIDAIKNGNRVILVDDEDSTNGGVFVMASQLVTPQTINHLMKGGTGFTYIALPEEKVETLRIGDFGLKGSAYSFSVDAAETENGISAPERTLTIQKLLEEGMETQRFRVPGHVFVLKAVKGGVLKKAGNGEAAMDLAVLAGLYPSGIISEILNEDGSIPKMEELLSLSEKEALPILSIEDLIAYRRETECYVVREAEANLPTAYGDFRMVGFVNKLNGEHHVALVKGDIHEEDVVLVRVHSECLTGDAFHSLKCDCGEQLAAALHNIEKEGKGVLLYLRQEGRGIGLINKIKAYKLQEEGMDTEEANIALGFPPDMRDYGIGAQILSELKVRKIKLMTNNPKKIIGLKGHGIEIVDRVPIIMDTNIHNEHYFKTKKEKMGHLY